MSPLPSAIRCASVASTGADVITGEQIRTFSAWPIFFASRAVRASANPGVNHGRTRTPSTTTGRGSTKPLCSTSAPPHSSSKSSVNACASSGEVTVTTTFSCRDHESSVQFVEPVKTRLVVAHDELVVHQVGHARDRLRRHLERGDQLHVRLRRRRDRDRVRVVDVVEDPHGHPARLRLPQRSAHHRGRLLAEVEVVLGQVERPLSRREEVGNLARDLRRLLAAVRQSADVDGRAHRAVAPCPDRRDLQLLS